MKTRKPDNDELKGAVAYELMLYFKTWGLSPKVPKNRKLLLALADQFYATHKDNLLKAVDKVTAIRRQDQIAA